MTNLPLTPPTLLPTAASQRAAELIRACVHCGFCNATCPTYILSGDEREGPRGRLYLMKDLLAGAQLPSTALAPLDHCLSCRSCETTCPAGVHYTEILDTTREALATARPWRERTVDHILERILGNRSLIGFTLDWLRRVRPVAPASIKRRVLLPATDPLKWPHPRHARKVGLLQGCVQPHLAPDIDIKAAWVLDALGISPIALGPTCCGALPYHLHETDKARNQAMQQLSLPIEDYEGITSTATGCTLFLRDYPRLMRDTTLYGTATTFADKIADLAHWIDPKKLPLLPTSERRRIAFHAPCTLTHGLKGARLVENILTALGHTLVPVGENALCCGSAGPYSLRYPTWGAMLGRRKWKALTMTPADHVVTANIGCLQHLTTHGDRPVQHWIEIVFAALPRFVEATPIKNETRI